MTRICAISDLHGQLPNIKNKFDILLIAGDIIDLHIQRSSIASVYWFNTVFVDWVNSLPFKDEDSKVIWIAGNHEVGLSNISKEARLDLGSKVLELTHNRAYYLEDSFIKTHDLTIYGTPWCKQFGYWGFTKSNNELHAIYSNIPEDVDILLTHDAPYGVSDECYEWLLEGRKLEHIGNVPLRNVILDKCPRYNIHGHLHSSNHEEETLGITRVYCVSLLNEQYELKYNPLTICE